MNWQTWHRLALLSFLAVALSGDVEARPGGGHSYSGGGSSYSGGGSSYSGGGSSYSGGGSSWGGNSDYSGGGGDLVLLLLFIPIILIAFMLSAAVKAQQEPLSLDSHSFAAPEPPRVTLEPLYRDDPQFSEIILKDFLSNLYIQAQEKRTNKEDLATLAPYLSPTAQKQLLRRRHPMPEGVSHVVIGSLRFSRVTDGTSVHRIRFVVSSNYTERGGDWRYARHFYAEEVWSIVRKKGVRSRPPERTSLLHCPNCDAPAKDTIDEPCASCGAVFDGSNLDWYVEGIQLVSEQPVGPRLTGTVQERGTGWQTVYDRARRANLDTLCQRDPAFNEHNFLARVRHVYHELNNAWSSLEWDLVRPHTSDRFWHSQTYWIDAYKKQGLRNLMFGAEVTKLELVKVRTDAYYDAITVRLFANACDHTIDNETGRVVAGSATIPRSYSEYWTFIRGATAKGAAKTDQKCPNCGAALAINMAGQCDFCEAKVNSGNFDWVLSQIEQDEAYRG